MKLLPPGPAAPAPLRWLSTLVDWVIVVLGAALVVVVFVNVVMHAFDMDLAAATEFGELVMVWTTFLGMAAAVQRNGHMSVTELIDLVPEGGPRLVADAAIQLIVGGVLFLLLWKGGIAVNASWGNTLTVLDWPMAIQYMPLPLSAGIALIFVLWDLVQIARRVPRQRRYAPLGSSTA